MVNSELHDLQALIEQLKSISLNLVEPESTSLFLYRLKNLADQISSTLKENQEFSGMQSSTASKIDQPFIWESDVIGELFKNLEKMAQADLPILILGESGTGKELIADHVHKISHRSSGPLIRVDCAALPNELIESELFGVAKGAFTDAERDKSGYFERANGGSIYLDEISELSIVAQAKLLRVLQDGCVQPVGSEHPIKTDVRVIAATHKNLSNALETSGFRHDLYYRLAVLIVEIPPLRNRPEDIALLANHFLEIHHTRNPDVPSAFTIAAMGDLLAYRWPGNVRELQNVLERAIVKGAGKPLLTPEDVSINGISSCNRPYSGGALKSSVALFKKKFIAETLRENKGNRTLAARELGIQRTYLSKLIKELEL